MFELLIIVVIFGAGIYFLKKGITTLIFGSKETPKTILSNNILTPEFVKCSNFRKKDGKIERGSCELQVNESQFVIIQGENKIENNIDSIYYFEIWEYKDDTYFKFMMRSHTEYMFKSIYFEADKISKILSKYDIKIEDNRVNG